MIDKKFKEILAKVEERKVMLSKEIMYKYESAMFKVNDKLKACKE
jgi:hypothetical protein